MQFGLMKIGLAGLGLMGATIAGRLIDTGHLLTVYNRNSIKTGPFANRGVTVASTPKELAQDSDFILISVTNFIAVKEICFGNEGILACNSKGGRNTRQHLTGAPMACGVVSDQGLKQVLLNSGIDILGQEINTITWFNGLILGLAAERNIEAIGLFGEISETTTPQPLAAKSILKAFAKIENMELDTKGLDKQYESILEDIQKQKEPSRDWLTIKQINK